MKSQKVAQVAGVTAALLSVGIIGIAAAGTVSAASVSNTVSSQMTDHPMRLQLKDIQRSVQNTANGIQITMTSTDAATVTKLQSMKQPSPPPSSQTSSNITMTQTNISNGIQITVSSTDAATVTKLQQGGQNSHGFGFWGGHGRGDNSNNQQPTQPPNNNLKSYYSLT